MKRVTSTKWNQAYFKRKPWVRYVLWARRRCKAGEDSRWWPFYGAKGIACTISIPEAEILWKRDGAAEMKKPSLDRIDAALGYTFFNCRFIEWYANVRLPHLGGATTAAELSEIGAGFS